MNLKPIETIYQEIIAICKDKLGIDVTEERLKYVFRFDDIYINPLWKNDNKEAYLQSFDGIIIVVYRDRQLVNFNKSILFFFDRQNGEYNSVHSDNANYQMWKDEDFVLYEGENIIGVVFEYE